MKIVTMDGVPVPLSMSQIFKLISNGIELHMVHWNVQYNLYSETAQKEVIKLVSDSRWSLNAGSIRLIED